MDGIIPLWKPKGMTSHDCVFKIRKILKTKKVGHGGTLDPNVEGVLPICVGKATKLIDYLHEYPKTYYGTISLGTSTTTEDSDGEIVEQVALTAIPDIDVIDHQMAKFQGKISQVPPMYSAVKVNGKRLYEYARENIQVERPQREVEIYHFQRMTEPIMTNNNVEWSFLTKCSKGTYIRTLAVDLGASLGYPAHMKSLSRLSSGGFETKEAVKLEDVEEAVNTKMLHTVLYPIEKITSQFTNYHLTAAEYKKVCNGQFLQLNLAEVNEVALYYGKRCVAIYELRDQVWKPQKMLNLEL